MINRKIGNFIWNVISPSEYSIQGQDSVRVQFDGKTWNLIGVKTTLGGRISCRNLLKLVSEFDRLVQTVALEIEQHGYL